MPPHVWKRSRAGSSTHSATAFWIVLPVAQGSEAGVGKEQSYCAITPAETERPSAFATFAQQCSQMVGLRNTVSFRGRLQGTSDRALPFFDHLHFHSCMKGLVLATTNIVEKATCFKALKQASRSILLGGGDQGLQFFATLRLQGLSVGGTGPSIGGCGPLNSQQGARTLRLIEPRGRGSRGLVLRGWKGIKQAISKHCTVTSRLFSIVVWLATRSRFLNGAVRFSRKCHA